MVEGESNLKWLFASDVDDTILGDENALKDLARELSDHRHNIVIAYNSSRPCASVRASLTDHPGMPEPDYVIGALGTEIVGWPSNRLDQEYSQRLMAGWDRDSIARMMGELGFQPHKEEYQTAFKASYHVPDAANYQKVLDQLDSNHLRAKVIYSGGKNLDLIPINADKGLAVVYMRERLALPLKRVVVAGDSANDLDMFSHNFKGIVVANADADLRSLSDPNIYHAKATCAQGVLEGLRYWRVIP